MRKWQPEEDALLYIMHPEDIAENIGRTVKAVRRRKEKLGVGFPLCGCGKPMINRKDVCVHCERDRNRLMVLQMKAKPCTVCGNSFPTECMDYHHIDTDDKITEISFMLSRNYRSETLLAEIAKCQLVCSNCHRTIHATP